MRLKISVILAAMLGFSVVSTSMSFAADGDKINIQEHFGSVERAFTFSPPNNNIVNLTYKPDNTISLEVWSSDQARLLFSDTGVWRVKEVTNICATYKVRRQGEEGCGSFEMGASAGSLQFYNANGNKGPLMRPR